MSKTQYYCGASLDGYMADADDRIDWLTDYRGRFEGQGGVPLEGTYETFYEGVGALVMGSATYDFILGSLASGGEWPYKGKPTWVLSSRELPGLDDADAELHIVSAQIRDLLDEMRAAAGERNLWVVGGGNIASQFADERLLDEVLVTVVPVILGHGKPLFARPLPDGPMRLIDARPFDNGMVELVYRVR
jgi:dihydrofolate reductase